MVPDIVFQCAYNGRFYKSTRLDEFKRHKLQSPYAVMLRCPFCRRKHLYISEDEGNGRFEMYPDNPKW